MKLKTVILVRQVYGRLKEHLHLQYNANMTYDQVRSIIATYAKTRASYVSQMNHGDNVDVSRLSYDQPSEYIDFLRKEKEQAKRVSKAQGSPRQGEGRHRKVCPQGKREEGEDYQDVLDLQQTRPLCPGVPPRTSPPIYWDGGRVDRRLVRL